MMTKQRSSTTHPSVSDRPGRGVADQPAQPTTPTQPAGQPAEAAPVAEATSRLVIAWTLAETSLRITWEAVALGDLY